MPQRAGFPQRSLQSGAREARLFVRTAIVRANRRGQHDFPAVEALGEARRRVRFHPAYAEDGQEEILREPTPITLCLKVTEHQLDLPLGDSLAETEENIGRSEVAVVLRELVLEDEVISERVPRQFGREPMVLMAVVRVMGEDEIRDKPGLQVFEYLLHLAADVRQKSVSVVVDDHVTARRALEKCLCALFRLLRPRAGRT